MADISGLGNVLTAAAAIMGAERLLLGQLKEVDPDALYKEIQLNQPLSPDPFQVLAPFYLNNPAAFEEHYSVDFILKKLREARPDLWTLLTACPGGVDWLGARRSEIMDQMRGGIC